jgi:hypothetical protein
LEFADELVLEIGLVEIVLAHYTPELVEVALYVLERV